MKELSKSSLPGIPTLLVLLALLLADTAQLVTGAEAGAMTPFMLLAAMAFPVLLVCLGGFYMVEPNQAAVLSLFGKYVGTNKDAGLRWNNPFFSKRKVSLRARASSKAR